MAVNPARVESVNHLERVLAAFAEVHVNDLLPKK